MVLLPRGISCFVDFEILLILSSSVCFQAVLLISAGRLFSSGGTRCVPQLYQFLTVSYTPESDLLSDFQIDTCHLNTLIDSTKRVNMRCHSVPLHTMPLARNLPTLIILPPHRRDSHVAISALQALPTQSYLFKDL